MKFYVSVIRKSVGSELAPRDTREAADQAFIYWVEQAKNDPDIIEVLLEQGEEDFNGTDRLLARWGKEPKPL